MTYGVMWYDMLYGIVCGVAYVMWMRYSVIHGMCYY